uniref:Uncharacterized protein n=1 Tax=viral metagenome TaxID=1070528 RepID=A0A6C0JS38_9ZZZZ
MNSAPVLIAVLVVICVGVALVLKGRLTTLTGVCAFSSLVGIICFIALIQSTSSAGGISPSFENIAITAALVLSLLIPISICIGKACMELVETSQCQ